MGSILATAPVKVLPGNALTVKVAFWPGRTLPMSASLTCAATCGDDTSVRAINPSVVAEDVVVDVPLLLDPPPPPDAPPLMYWPGEAAMLATKPPVGAVSVAARKLFSAIERAARAFST